MDCPRQQEHWINIYKSAGTDWKMWRLLGTARWEDVDFAGSLHLEVRQGVCTWRWDLGDQSWGGGRARARMSHALPWPCRLPSPGVLAGPLSSLILTCSPVKWRPWEFCPWRSPVKAKWEKVWKLPLHTARHMWELLLFFFSLLHTWE